tara:strand:+ start:9538 stop:10230 length:693 start_codon:yes stop_codon:yes gene_type:complete
MKIAIILAKSYSKRIPNKNFLKFHGKPMIYWTIQAAKKSKLFDKIIIATDSDKIIKKFKKYNIDFIKRPKELNKEKYGIDEVMKYCLSYLSEKVEYACCLYACAPLISYRDIKSGLSKIETNKYKYIFAASNFSHPVERSFKVDKGKIKMISKKFFNTTSKFFTETYHDTGYLYWAKASTWKKDFISYGSKSSFVKIPNWRAQDLDTLDDLKKVDLIFQSLKRRKKHEKI